MTHLWYMQSFEQIHSDRLGQGFAFGRNKTLPGGLSYSRRRSIYCCAFTVLKPGLRVIQLFHIDIELTLICILAALLKFEHADALFLQSIDNAVIARTNAIWPPRQVRQ